MNWDRRGFDILSWSWVNQHDASGSSLPLSLDEISRSPTIQRNLELTNMELVEFESISIGDPLRVKFVDMISNFPNGVSVHQFMSKFKDLHGYYPDYTNFQSSSMESWCRSLQEVFCVADSPLGQALLFPSHLHGATFNTQKLFKNCWDQIKILLQHNGYVLKVENIPAELFRRFRIQITPSDWHCEGDMTFYNFCLRKWPNSNHLQPIFLEADLEEPSKKVLVQLHPDFPNTVEYYRKQGEIAKLGIELGITSSEFVRFGDKLRSMTDNLKSGKYYKCISAAVHTPGHFYVIISYNWTRLEDLMKDMQEVYSDQNTSGEVPSSETLVVGLYVAAKCKFDCKWRRAIIKKVDHFKYEVYCIDYGEVETVGIESLRFLKLSFFNRLDGQAIRCLAKVGRLYNAEVPGIGKDMFNRGSGWTQEEGHILREKVKDVTLAVKFIARKYIEGLPVWQVFLHALDASSEVQLNGLHIEREVMRQSRKFYAAAIDDEVDNYADVQLVSPLDFFGPRIVLDPDP